jgi:DNA-binding CsgD family transcriptional regulator
MHSYHLYWPFPHATQTGDFGSSAELKGSSARIEAEPAIISATMGGTSDTVSEKALRLYRTRFEDPVLGAAVTEVLEHSGWRHEARSELVIADRPAEGCVLVLRSYPADCALVVQELGLGVVAAIVCEEDLAQLGSVLSAVVAGHRLIARRVLELAQSLPMLTRRQHVVLHDLCGGHQLQRLTRELRSSPATVKREIKRLQDALGVTSRVQLALAAHRLGYPTPLVDIAASNTKTSVPRTPVS